MIGRKVYLTIDIDFTNYVDNSACDELSETFSEIWSIFGTLPNISSTWFVRIDSQIEELYGEADYILRRHTEIFSRLRSAGHEIGWHHHSYKRTGEYWSAETSDDVICRQLNRYGPIARQHDLSICRMGWGYQTNKTIEMLESLAFEIDSSAIPRPCYPWCTPGVNWENTGQYPYYPSIGDYRIAAEPARRILEVPISTVSLPLDTDTQPGVIRYINPAYKPEIFRAAVGRYRLSDIVLIMHPYELIAATSGSGVIAFDFEAFRENLFFLATNGFVFHNLKRLRQ